MKLNTAQKWFGITLMAIAFIWLMIPAFIGMYYALMESPVREGILSGMAVFAIFVVGMILYLRTTQREVRRLWRPGPETQPHGQHQARRTRLAWKPVL